MKIGGMTFINTANYGTCLQAYALQTAVEKLGGYDYSIINYMGEKDRRTKSLIKKTVGQSTKHYFVQKIIGMPLRIYRNIIFQSFTKHNCKYTKECRSMRDLKALNNEYDVFMCGSDVVWRNATNYSDPAYYLCFSDKPRISYAASLGQGQISLNDEKIYEKHIPDFDYISVRETHSRQIISKYTNKPIAITLDPVLLLNKSEWERVAKQKSHKKPYILVYIAFVSPIVDVFAKQLQRQTGYRIIRVSAYMKDMLTHSCKMPSPQKWLSLMRDASYVITNSFHGTAFSLIYQRNFFTVVQGTKLDGINVRMFDLLERVDLVDRIYGTVPEEIDLSTPNFGGSNDLLADEIQNSMNYISNALAEVKKDMAER